MQELKEYYRIGLTYSSNAIEGNSLTEVETKVILEDGITIGGKQLKEHLEVTGHSDAYDYLYTLVNAKEIHEEDILKLHQLLYFRIDPENAGRYRTRQVFITGTEYLPPKPKVIPGRMKEFIRLIPELQKNHHPVELAGLVHKELVDIHPFIDGNGRCARLLMNLVLMQHGYVITIIPPVLRSEYIQLVKDAQLKKHGLQPFIDFISQMAYEAHKEYLRLLQALQ